jgi:superfamily II DNA/RNA helicase
LISEKQKTDNKKLVIFTVFADTANYLYSELKKRGFSKLALVSGQEYKCEYNIETRQGFEPILQRFAPYTKLFKEQDWTDLYTDNEIKSPKSFISWKKIIKKYDTKTQKKLSEPIDILIATDVLSEGQNLQDADTVVNYDVHWNPVRLIQRFGRIDRLGSPNNTVKSINFWPAKNMDDYLDLKNRVENRLALMTVVGSEIVELDEEFKERIKNNPLISKQTENMLKQMQTSWKDIETSPTNLGLNNLSLEEYRQDLFDYLQNRREELEKIPNGVFSGFKLVTKLKKEYNSGILALIAYPQKPEKASKDFNYTKKELIYTDNKGEIFIVNNIDALNFLKQNKNQKRFVSEKIEKGDENELANFIDLIQKWMDKKTGKQAEKNIMDLLQGGSTKKAKKSKKEKYLEELYCSDKWDLITWFAVTK